MADRPAANAAPAIRPLRRIGDGVWASRDDHWRFARHWGDPHPQRWYGYLDASPYPANEGLGHVSLREVAAWAAEQTGHLTTPEKETPR